MKNKDNQKFKVGASIFPRSLYFVDFISCNVRKGIRDEIEAINQVVAKLLNPNNHHVKEDIKCLPICN